MTRFGTEKLWLGGAAVVGLLLVVIGYFFLIGPQRARTSDISSQVGDSQFQATSLQGRITTLTAQSHDIAGYRAALAAAQRALPTADDVGATPDLLRSLQTLGARTGTTVTTVTVGQPEAVTAPAPAAPAAGASSSTSSAPAPAAPAATTGAQLSSIAVGATVSGTMAHLDAFLTQLQTAQPRAVLVTAVTVTAGSADGSSGSTTLALTMSVFVRPPATTTPTPPAASSAAPSGSTP